jgi:septum site-determining protein MinC
VTALAETRRSLRFRGRSFLALVLSPEPPVEAWLGEVDDWLSRSPGFFRGRPVILDCAAMDFDTEGLMALLGELGRREIRILGLEGAKTAILTPALPPLVSAGREAAEPVDPAIIAPKATGNASGGKGDAVPMPSPAERPEMRSMIVADPVRSGQSILFPQGDVTIIGSVASGAEVIAGGSIHIYGALRGRAIAGAMGAPKSRIFAGKMEAELIAIDGLYSTADDMAANIRGCAAQAWLDGNSIRMTPLA